MSYNAPKSGVVTWQNRVNGSATTNVTTTSSSTFIPFLTGNMTEVAFDTICIGNAVSSNFTGTTSLNMNAFEGVFCCQNNNGNNGNTVTYQTPGNIDTGVYKVEYKMVFGNIAGIVDVSYQANGAGSFTNIRAGVDCYTSLGDGYIVDFVEFITVTTGGNPISIRWTANGKNASSGNYWVRPAGPVRITQLG